MSRPQQIKDNITANANGTYTVTLYPDGKATEVTVSGDVAVDGEGDAFYAGGPLEDQAPNWVSIYEKASAQLIGDGSFAGLRAGHPATGIEVTTGRETETYGPGSWGSGHVSVQQVQQLLDEGHPMTCLTQHRWSDTTIASWHVYFVAEVDSDGLIVVRNPWGHGNRSGVQEELRLTEEEFNETFALESSGS